jgi:alcohol dehydrogenase
MGDRRMRAAVIHEHGGRDKLVVEEVPRPTVVPGEILVSVKACGLNHLDIFIRRGMPGVHVDLPRIGGGDIAGVVAEVGEGATGLEPGARVLLDPMITLPDGRPGALGEHATGGLAEYLAVPAENAIPLPDDVSFEQAAALPIAYGTAWRMLISRGGIKPGEHVLVLGASGGVGTGCVQIAKMKGCVVYAAASTDDKLQRLKQLGADVLINYSETPEFHRVVRGMTDGRGIDVVVDYTGAGTWVKSLKSLRLGGRLLTCGATSGHDPKTDIRFIWTRELTIVGSDGWRRGDLELLLEAVRKQTIKPIIDRVLPLHEIREGHRLLEDRGVFGKVIITPGGGPP